jgi:hypothetical protein
VDAAAGVDAVAEVGVAAAIAVLLPLLQELETLGAVPPEVGEAVVEVAAIAEVVDVEAAADAEEEVAAAEAE